ncbi:MAG: rhodanese-like domain-containing protein, partial [Chitinophagales bacterium]
MQIEQLLKKGATIIDVRTAMEFSMGNVEGSINIPLGEIMMHVDELREMQKPL